MINQKFPQRTSAFCRKRWRGKETNSRSTVQPKHKHILNSWISESFRFASLSWNEILKTISISSLKGIRNYLSRAECPERKLWSSSLLGAEEGRMLMVPHQLPPCHLWWPGKEEGEGGCSNLQISRHIKECGAVCRSWINNLIYCSLDLRSPCRLVKCEPHPRKKKKKGVLLLLCLRFCLQLKKENIINKDFFFAYFIWYKLSIKAGRSNTTFFCKSCVRDSPSEHSFCFYSHLFCSELPVNHVGWDIMAFQ